MERIFFLLDCYRTSFIGVGKGGLSTSHRLDHHLFKVNCGLYFILLCIVSHLSILKAHPNIMVPLSFFIFTSILYFVSVNLFFI